VRWFSLWPVLRERGLTMVLWSDWGHDATLDARSIAKATLDQLRPGSIILLHDGFEARPDGQTDRSATVEALPAIIEGARRAGYTFVPVPDRGPAALVVKEPEIALRTLPWLGRSLVGAH
jgi:peptidoglycan/xylan/chitin deacetylase (PgdA/CDA1 family)